MRTFLAMLVGAAVLATAVVSVRLHLHVAHLRYRLWTLDQDRVRAEREQRLARADLEAAKAPRRLLERWAEMREEGAGAAPVLVATPAIAPVPMPRPAPDDADLETVEGPADAGATAPEAAPEAPSRPPLPDEPPPVDEEGR